MRSDKLTVGTVPNTCIHSRCHAVSDCPHVVDITSPSFPIVIHMLITMATVETFKFPGVDQTVSSDTNSFDEGTL